MSDTIRVELKNTWFAPTSIVKKNKLQQMSGRRFKKGVYTWPVSVKEYLPKSAVILGEKEPEVDEFEPGFSGFDDGDDLGNFDVARAAAEEEERIRAEAEAADKITKSPEEILAQRQAHMREINERRAFAKATAAAKGAAEAQAAKEAAAAAAEAPEAPAVRTEEKF